MYQNYYLLVSIYQKQRRKKLQRRKKHERKEPGKEAREWSGFVVIRKLMV